MRAASGDSESSRIRSGVADNGRFHSDHRRVTRFLLLQDRLEGGRIRTGLKQQSRRRSGEKIPFRRPKRLRVEFRPLLRAGKPELVGLGGMESHEVLPLNSVKPHRHEVIGRKRASQRRVQAMAGNRNRTGRDGEMALANRMVQLSAGRASPFVIPIIQDIGGKRFDRINDPQPSDLGSHLGTARLRRFEPRPSCRPTSPHWPIRPPLPK